MMYYFFLRHGVCVFVTVTALRIDDDGNKGATFLVTYSTESAQLL